mgnify:CR=1 FL=1
MSENKEIIYDSKCDTCEAHKTDLGTLKALEETIKKNFPEFSTEQQLQILLTWWTQYKTDNRMHYIEQSKQKTTAQIQKYKQSNIRAINKGNE